MLAGLASAKFALLANELLPEKRGQVPHFDARAWSVPTPELAVEAVAWRVADARKNSIAIAAQSVYSHKQLLNKCGDEQLAMLKDKGIDWTAYPDFFRVGTFVRRVNVQVQIEESERLQIPERHRPESGAMVTRSRMLEVAAPAVLTWEWLLHGATP